MKLLFNDKVVAALRKIPTAVWFIFLAITCFFEQCHTIITTVGSVFGAYGLSINIVQTVVFYVFEGLISAAILELFIYIGYHFARRYACAMNNKDFSFRLRIVLIISNTILGLFNLTQFLKSEWSGIVEACTNVVVPTLLIAWYYESFRGKFLPKRNQSRYFGLIAAIYFVIAILSKLFGAFGATFGDFFSKIIGEEGTATSVGTVTMIAYWLDLGVAVVMGVLAYLNYKRLDKIGKEPEDNDLFIPKEPENNTIFKDLGF